MFQYEGAMLVYPAEKDLLEKHGLPDESTLAMVVPHNVVRLTSQ